MNFLTFVQVPSEWYYRYDGDSSYRNVRLYEDTAATTDYAFAWNFNDSPATPVGEEIYRTWHTAGDKTVTVTATRSGQTATASRAVTITGSGVFAARINFQPATAPVPFGFVPDTGAVYADRGNGYTYGWNTPNTSAVDAEFFVHSRSQERDTTIRQTTRAGVDAQPTFLSDAKMVWVEEGSPTVLRWRSFNSATTGTIPYGADASARNPYGVPLHQ